MAVSDRNDVITEIFKSRTILIGSPTLNRGLLPTIMPILEDCRGLRFQNKLGAAFGSYGWSGEAVKLINRELEAMKFDIVEPVQSDLVKEVLVHSLMNPTQTGSRLRAVSFASDMTEPKVTEALIFAMRNDENLAVRLRAIGIDMARRAKEQVAGRAGGDGISGMNRLYNYEAMIHVLEGVQAWILNYAREARRLGSIR